MYWTLPVACWLSEVLASEKGEPGREREASRSQWTPWLLPGVFIVQVQVGKDATWHMTAFTSRPLIFPAPSRLNWAFGIEVHDVDMD